MFVGCCEGRKGGGWEEGEGEGGGIMRKRGQQGSREEAPCYLKFLYTVLIVAQLVSTVVVSVVRNLL